MARSFSKEGKAENEYDSVLKHQNRIYKNTLLWIDQKQSTEEKQVLSQAFPLIKVQTIEDAFIYQQKNGQFNHISIICSGSLAEEFLEKINKNEYKVKNVYIFCCNVSKYIDLKDKYNKVICVVNDTTELLNIIDSNIDSLELPNYRKFADNTQKSIQIKYSYFLAFLTLPVNEKRKRQKLIEIFGAAMMEYLKNRQFIFEYPLEYLPYKVIQLYTGDYFYSYVNAKLKASMISSLEIPHIMISDLHKVIIDHSNFQRRSKVQSVLYRGGFLTESEIALLPQYVNSQIQFLSYISTSKDKQIAIQYFQRNALFTLYIPNFFKHSDSQDFKIRGGYLDIEVFKDFIKPKYNEFEVLFNIKNIMTVFRVSNIKGIVNVELIYGIDQILCWMNEKSRENIQSQRFHVHDQQPRNWKKKCPKYQSNLHVIGTLSKRKFCLEDLTRDQICRESFILVNQNNYITGMPLAYDQKVEQNVTEMGQFAVSSRICKSCSSFIKCSDCKDKICLCSLKNHQSSHLMNSVILIQGEMPRFLSLTLRREELFLHSTHIEIEGSIKRKADALFRINTEEMMLQAERLYTQEINDPEFNNLDNRSKYDLYFDRGQSIRMRKYLNKCKKKIAQQEFKQTLKNYEVAEALAQKMENQNLLKSKAFLYKGITLDCLKNFEEAHLYYGKAMKLLDQIQGTRPLTNNENRLKIQILNGEGFYQWHNGKLQEAAQLFRNTQKILKSINLIDKVNQAKYLNNLACVLLQIGTHKKEAVEMSKQSYQIRLCIYGAEHDSTLSSLRNYKKALKALSEA